MCVYTRTQDKHNAYSASQGSCGNQVRRETGKDSTNVISTDKVRFKSKSLEHA